MSTKINSSPLVKTYTLEEFWQLPDPPGRAIYDRNTKADTYGALGVREIWLVDEVAQSVEVRQHTGEVFDEGQMFSRGEQIRSIVFPALKLSVEQLFTD